jgi:uncharacterized protein (TIGR02453 family)
MGTGIAQPVFTPETFQFFRQLKRNNHKVWMDKNRERYQECIVTPFRRLLEEVTPAILEIDERFEINGKTGKNFSRINRDIRFAKDKTLYKPQMYLKFQHPSPEKRENGQLYVSLAVDCVTAGFRIYCGAKRRESMLAMIAVPRVAENPQWVREQKRRLGRRYESYWYETQKGDWTKREGWPTEPEHWKKIRAWIVRKKMVPECATKRVFVKDLAKLWKELYPLLEFTSIP